MLGNGYYRVCTRGRGYYGICARAGAITIVRPGCALSLTLSTSHFFVIVLKYRFQLSPLSPSKYCKMCTLYIVQFIMYTLYLFIDVYCVLCEWNNVCKLSCTECTMYIVHNTNA